MEEIGTGQKLFRNGETKAALAHFESLRSRYPRVARVWLHSAFLLDRVGRENEAIPLYRQALSLGLRGRDRRQVPQHAAQQIPRSVPKPKLTATGLPSPN